MADEVKVPISKENGTMATITQVNVPVEAIPIAQNAPSEEIKPEVAPVPTETKEKQEGPGRPTKRDPLTVKKLEEAFAFDCTVGEACLYAGITPKTYYNWINEDEELLQRFEALRETPILAAREKVVSAIKSDVDTAKWYLERKQKKEFASRTEHTGPDGKDLIPLTEEQTQKLDRLANLGKQNGTTGAN